jgi:type IV pilus assembly protein PilM
MAFSLFSPRKRIVNLVINDRSIRFVELKQVKPPTAGRWSERLLPPGIIADAKIVDGEALANILEERIEEWKIQRRRFGILSRTQNPLSQFADTQTP